MQKDDEKKRMEEKDRTNTWRANQNKNEDTKNKKTRKRIKGRKN